MARIPPNVIKARKQRRNGRRAYLTPIMGLIKVPRRVGNTEVPEDMKPWLEYRRRGNTFWENILDSVPKMFNANKLEVIKRLSELTSKLPEPCNITVREGGITQTKVKFFFQPDYRYCFWVKEDWRNMVIKKSMEYHGPGARDRAYFDLEHNRISWMEVVEISPTE